ncbi:MAG TPA: hypothetical protein VM487_21175 [Phycisphaerae bacterium]|nr:hypothetical protein [Phycisphaerae bacterium]
METDPNIWEKRGIEIPPGWHATMKRLSALTGVGLKYLYALALDRLMSDPDFSGLSEAASSLQRISRKDLRDLARRHTVEALNKRHEKQRRRKPSAKKM